jgi:riboflavin biosynthesis pyrimidine reductase
VLAALGERGADVVLAEGGPTFNGQLVDSGLIDELCLSISPHLVGGGSSRIVNGSEAAIPDDLRLDRLLEHDNALFARYVRA